MRAHLRYLRYLLAHKFYVARAGFVIHEWWHLRWLWRMLVHDLSKFRPNEWGAYAHYYYDREVGNATAKRAAFNVAWLKHLHANDHHWQHWVLHEHSGKTFVLVPPAICADEMLANWLGAGPKVHGWHTMADAVRATIVWYAQVQATLQLRALVRHRVESTLLQLAERYGIAQEAADMRASLASRVSVAVPRG